MSAYIRVVAAIGAGWLADRYTARGVIGAIFAALTVSYGYLAFADGSAELLQLTYANIFVTFVGVYGLRGVYFALLQETAIPAQRTGTAVGLISLVGFTPDIFFAPIAGRLLDASPGVAGQQHFFALLTAIATAGVVCTVVLSRAVRRENTP
jgi:nitrate/nitrite transporter NarK